MNQAEQLGALDQKHRRSSLELSTIKLLELQCCILRGSQWWLLTLEESNPTGERNSSSTAVGPRCTVNGLQGFVAVLLKNLMVDEFLFLQNLRPTCVVLERIFGVGC